MSDRRKFAFLLPLFFALRLAFGLWARPVQIMIDEVQTYLIGLKFYCTGAWPYYGNDVIAPPDNIALLTQDPGALEGLLIGGPLYAWPSPLAPFLLLNLLTLAGYSFFAYYCCRRLPKLSPWFIFPWVLTAPWCVHYSTSMINLSYSTAAACFFFVALMESLPPLSLGWLPLAWANALMGFSLAWWTQFHRTWVVVTPFLAASFFLQWKKSHKITAPFYFLLGALPLEALVIPTLLRPDYHFFRDVSGLSFGLNLHNFLSFFVILAQFLSLASFELPRFIGAHTVERIHYLSENWLLIPGLFLWYFGILQVLILLGFLFDSRNPRPDWKPVRWFAVLIFLMVYGSLLFTIKKPDVNTYCEMLPVVMLYSLYVWDRWWMNRWGRRFLCFFLAIALLFQVVYVFIQPIKRESFYLMYHDAIAQAIRDKNYHLLGERRAGSFY